jgi:hypothetical protein
MRIAVLIIGLCLSLAVGIQSFLIAAGGGIGGDKSLSQGGVAGMGVAVLFIIGSAFALGLPRIAAVVFGLAGLVAFGGASGSKFTDLQIWGFLSLALAVASIIGSFGLRKQKREREAEKQLLRDLATKAAGANQTAS